MNLNQTVTRFCPFDGARLEAEGLDTIEVTPAPTGRGQICPKCGAHYSADTKFCGLDGSPLVLLN